MADSFDDDLHAAHAAGTAGASDDDAASGLDVFVGKDGVEEATDGFDVFVEDGADTDDGAPVADAQMAAAAPAEKPKKSTGWRIVFWVALAACVVCVGIIVAIIWGYWNGQNSYEEVAAETGIDETSDDLPHQTVNWDALRAINSDIVAWMIVPDTIIDYPVVQTTDNDTYLYKSFEGEWGGRWMPTYGTPFLDTTNSPEFTDRNSVIYGHNLLNGSMFATFGVDYPDANFFNAHKTMYFYTPAGNYQLEAVTLVHADADEKIVQTGFADKAAWMTYVQDKLDRSIVPLDAATPAASDIDQLFMFSTCDSSDSSKRYVIYFRVVEFIPTGSDTPSLTPAQVTAEGDESMAQAIAANDAAVAAKVDAAVAESAANEANANTSGQ